MAENDAIIERLIRVAEDQSAASGALVELQREVRNDLAILRANSVAQTTALTALVKSTEAGQSIADDAVVRVNNHTSATARKAGRWDGILKAVIAAAATVTAAALATIAATGGHK